MGFSAEWVGLGSLPNRSVYSDVTLRHAQASRIIQARRRRKNRPGNQMRARPILCQYRPTYARND